MSDQVTTQTLTLPEDHFDDLRAGKRIWTIRDGEREIEPGFLMYEGMDDKSVTEFVWVTDVYYIRLKGASVKTSEKLEDLIEKLTPFYPDIDGETKVTLILHLTVAETKKIFPQSA